MALSRDDLDELYDAYLARAYRAKWVEERQQSAFFCVHCGAEQRTPHIEGCWMGELEAHVKAELARLDKKEEADVEKQD